MMTDLAIVIPAYKSDFLREALTSISQQTNKKFKLYIGDDASPYDLEEIIKDFASLIDITYHRFPENLGGIDLVGQWNRCIDLIGDESWCWLFSDDDILDEDCVEQFYIKRRQNPDSQLFHFNIKTIDEDSKVINEPNKFPGILGVSEFHLKRWRSEISSYVVEYVFSVDHFKANGGFERFNYAWHTDEATWTKLSYPNGVISIDEAYVRWRRSHVNITPNNKDIVIVNGKILADLDFTQWVKTFYAQKGLQFTFTHQYYLIKRFTHHLSISTKVLSTKDCLALLKRQLSILDKSYLYLFFRLYFHLILAKGNKYD